MSVDRLLLLLIDQLQCLLFPPGTQPSSFTSIHLVVLFFFFSMLFGEPCSTECYISAPAEIGLIARLTETATV